MWKITICEHLKTTIHNIIAMSRHTCYKYISENRDLKKKIQLFQNCYFDLYSAIFTLIFVAFSQKLRFWLRRKRRLYR